MQSKMLGLNINRDCILLDLYFVLIPNMSIISFILRLFLHREKLSVFTMSPAEFTHI